VKQGPSNGQARLWPPSTDRAGGISLGTCLFVYGRHAHASVSLVPRLSACDACAGACFSGLPVKPQRPGLQPARNAQALTSAALCALFRLAGAARGGVGLGSAAASPLGCGLGADSPPFARFFALPAPSAACRQVLGNAQASKLARDAAPRTSRATLARPSSTRNTPLQGRRCSA
jgi:hypothetical protein